MRPLRLLFSGLVFAGLASGGCECVEGDGGITQVLPEIEIDQTQIDFGEVPLGAVRLRSLRVSNLGNAKLTITAIDAASPFEARLLKTEVEPGTTETIDIVYRPETLDTHTGILQINSDDDENPQLGVGLSGTGVGGFLEIQPLRIDFTGTSIGTTRSGEIALFNRGGADVAGDIVPEHFLRPAHFELSGLSTFGSRAPFTVPARSDLVLELTYRPLLDGADNGSILFEHCGDRCGLEVKVLASADQSILRIDPPFVDFGSVGIDEARVQQVLVLNEGQQDLSVSEVGVQGTAEVVARPDSAVPRVVAPGETMSIDLEYIPRDATEMTADLLIKSTDAVTPEARVRLTGRGAGPLFVVEPEEINFGVQVVMTTSHRALQLLNAGSSEVRVEKVEISGDAELTLEAVPGLPVRLASGESVVPLVAFTPTESRQYNATITIESDDENLRLVEVPVTAGFGEQQCVLDVAPGRLNFGLVTPPTKREQSVMLTNQGTNECVLLSGAFRSPRDPAFTLTPVSFPVTLAPTARTELVFTYEPADFRPAKQTFELNTDDPVYPIRLIGLVGSSEAYDDLFVVPDRLDFGSRRIGCSSGSRQVQIFNAGTREQTIEEIVSTATTTELSVDLPAAPVTIQAGGSWVFTAEHTPVDLGMDEGLIEIRVEDQPYPFVVPMQGAGALRPHAQERFDQVSSRMVDVLFVIDDSCSMLDEQTALASNFASFIAAANVRSVDFQIGVTTTTFAPFGAPGRNGLLVGVPLNNTTADLEGTFQAQVNVGADGSGHEQGLAAMYAAFDLAQKKVPPNEYLFRQAQGAALVVIFFSDEDDQSPLSVVTYFNELRNQAGGSYLTAAVSGQKHGCNHPMTGSALPGTLYEDFLTFTGGISESICSNNWAVTLANIGSAAFGLRKSFVLSETLDQNEPVEVKVDGVILLSGWSYDPVVNAIVFEDATIPPENSVVEISFTPSC